MMHSEGTGNGPPHLITRHRFGHQSGVVLDFSQGENHIADVPPGGIHMHMGACLHFGIAIRGSLIVWISHVLCAQQVQV